MDHIFDGILLQCMFDCILQYKQTVVRPFQKFICHGPPGFSARPQSNLIIHAGYNLKQCDLVGRSTQFMTPHYSHMRCNKLSLVQSRKNSRNYFLRNFHRLCDFHRCNIIILLCKV